MKKNIDYNNLLKIDLLFYSDNFKNFFDSVIEKNGKATFGSLFYTYNFLLDKLMCDFTEDLYFFSSGCTFEGIGLTTKTGEPITEKSSRDDTFKAIEKHFMDKKQKLDKLLYEYSAELEKPVNMPLNEYITNQDVLNKKIIELVDYEMKKKEIDTGISIPGADVVYLYYPEFRSDLPLLIKHKYIQLENEKLTWIKSKQSLSEYFGNQIESDKNAKWEFVEKLFNVEGLKNSYSQNGSSYQKKLSKDYEEWLRIKNIPQSK